MPGFSSLHKPDISCILVLKKTSELNINVFCTCTKLYYVICITQNIFEPVKPKRNCDFKTIYFWSASFNKFQSVTSNIHFNKDIIIKLSKRFCTPAPSILTHKVTPLNKSLLYVLWFFCHEIAGTFQETYFYTNKRLSMWYKDFYW